jgi:primosomal protein N' (replication factor Y)
MYYYGALVCKTRTGRKLYTYCSEQELAIGLIVLVKFGRLKLPAIILQEQAKPKFKTNPIQAGYNIVLPPPFLKLIDWFLKFYPYDYGAIGSQFIPPNLSVNSRDQAPILIKSSPVRLPTPNAEQKRAIDNIGKYKKNILFGITGSGKTRVFSEEIKKTIINGKSVLVLTPEIGLTPQLINDLAKVSAAPIIVNHSLVSSAEKKRIFNYALTDHEPTIFIGPRSVLFTPSSNIGLIILDEFHDQSYKQMNNPRYNSLFVASAMANINDAKIIASSATPSVSDYYTMQAKGYQVSVLTKSAAGESQLTGEIISASDRDNFTKDNYISNQVIDAITEALKNKQQALVYINRRGSARLIQCASCGWSELCEICGLPMTYHHDLFKVICHSCGTRKNAPHQCPECGSVDISFKSVGTKTITEKLENLFPRAAVARFDADNEAAQKLHRRINDIKNQSVDIIVGTQMVSKGLDLPKLAVVAVLNADSSLALPDFSAEEQLFQQLYQVTGRVGRGHIDSKFFIQTNLPDHPVIRAVLNKDYQKFYKYELSKRKLFKYPPFVFMAVIKMHKKTARAAEANAEKLAQELSKYENITVLGPSQGFYEKTKDGYQWQIILKSSKRSALLKALAHITGSETSIDIDPLSAL